MQNRKGQAAMEFLMTYGWAILAAIIVIGVLAYFGVFRPGQFVPEATVVNPPFYANAWSVTNSPAQAQVEVQNNGGETLTVNAVAIAVTDGATSCTTDTTAKVITAGKLASANLACTGMEAAGEMFKGDITITYIKSGSGLNLTSSGTITATISP